MTRKIQRHPNKGLPIDLPQGSDMETCAVHYNRQRWCEPLVNKRYKARLHQSMFQPSRFQLLSMPQTKAVAVEIQQLNLVVKDIIILIDSNCNSRISEMPRQKIRTIVMIPLIIILVASKRQTMMVFLNIILQTLNSNSSRKKINNNSTSVSFSGMKTCRQLSKCRRDARLGMSYRARPGKVAWLNLPDNGRNVNVISIYILRPCLCAC